jgi:ribosomal-protein-alanine N-acetyltransferase
MIREFRLNDLKEVLRIEAQAFPKSAYSAEMFIRYHHLSPETFFVHEEEIVSGYAIFTSDGHVISLAVDRTHRRKGIGTALMNACESFCQGRSLLVEVRVSNRGAQDFYRTLGFQLRSRIRRYYGTEDAYIMEKIRDFFT